jgi:hypothetical protein
LTYPAHREADVVLRDGSTLSVRPVRREDESRLRRFFDRLSEESRTFRFVVDARVRVESRPPTRPWPSALERGSGPRLSSA